MNFNNPCVYLSPSVQQFNQYLGGGNEEEYMNLVADSVEKYLIQYGICYKRNRPEMSVSEIVNESNSGNYILHLAIHSNASGEGNEGMATGSEAYYYPTSQKGALLAGIIANNMKEIYYEPEKVTTKTSSSFAELKRTIAPSVLIEVAYHDNAEDVDWIKENIDEIGRVLALSVKEYIDEVCKCPAGNTGDVVTMGGNLNVRKEPNVNSEIIFKLPNGTNVNIISCNEKWYFIKYNSVEGYVFKHYISAD